MYRKDAENLLSAIRQKLAEEGNQRRLVVRQAERVTRWLRLHDVPRP